MNVERPASTDVVCRHCAQRVRVPTARLSEGPRCPRCKEGLFGRAPFALSDATFPGHIAGSGLPLVVDFWATWCGPCRSFAPVYEQAAAELEPDVLFAKVDTDACPQTAARFRIQSVPSLLLFRDGREVARQAGAMPLGALRRWLATHGVLPRGILTRAARSAR